MFFVLVLTTYARSEQRPIDRDWMAKTKNEITLLVERYQSVASRLEEECETRYEYKEQSGKPKSSGYQAHTLIQRSSRLGDNVILERTRNFDAEPDRRQTQLECDNEDYNFNLIRSQPDGPYALVGYVPGIRKSPLAVRWSGNASGPLLNLGNASKAIENAAPFTDPSVVR